MSVHTELYQPFWKAFEKTQIGPRDSSEIPPKPKLNKDRYNYMQIREDLDLRFRPIATLSQEKDRIGVELISASSSARCFANEMPIEIPEPQLGDNLDHLVFTKTETKLHLTWHEVSLENRAFWPAHFLWIRLGMDFLCRAYKPHLSKFNKLTGVP